MSKCDELNAKINDIADSVEYVPGGELTRENTCNQIYAFLRKRGVDVKADIGFHKNAASVEIQAEKALLLLEGFTPPRPKMDKAELRQHRRKTNEELKTSKIQEILDIKKAISLLTDLVGDKYKDPRGEVASKLSEIRRLIGEE